MRFPLLISLLVLCFGISNGQEEYKLRLHVTDNSPKLTLSKLRKNLSIKETYADSTDRRKAVNQIRFKLFDMGYLASSIDSMKADSVNLDVFLHLGNTYRWAIIANGNVDEGILSEIGFRQKVYNKKPIFYKQVRKLEEKTLVYLENNGYPFATIRLDSIKFSGDVIEAKLMLEKNMLCKIDTIHIKGTSKINRMYLYNYLSIKPGLTYNESLVKEISTRLKELPFLQESKPFELSFSDKGCKLFLYLENRKASQFDFIAGLVPDPKKASKVQFTGEAHLKLQNSFSHGEVLELNWKSPMPLTQDLKISLTYPFLFNTPFGIDASLSLYKKDTSYVDVTENLGIQYILKRGSYFKAFVVNKKSTLLDVKRFEQGLEKPDRLDLEALSYGIGCRTERVDYRLNPRKGFIAEINTTIGTRTIKKNGRLPDSIYSSIRLKTTIYNIDFNGDIFLPLGGKNVLNIGTKGAMYISPNVLTNELFRIGGLKSLRGFDEESILASTYTIGKIEYRYLTDQNSYLFMFYNMAYYENKAVTPIVHDNPYGIGAGITFETKLGIFSFSYALGKQYNNPLYLRNGKIHFGIISYF